jgi:dihydrofolate reductase
VNLIFIPGGAPKAHEVSYIWMMGGGEIIASFVDQGEIDEFRINVIPILIGEGIPPSFSLAIRLHSLFACL